MKLITQEILKKLQKFPRYSQEGKGNDAEILVKFFTPDSDWSWFVLEAEIVPDNMSFFGIVRSSMETVYGYFSLSEIESAHGPLGMKIERDMHFYIKTVGELRQSREIPLGVLDWIDKEDDEPDWNKVAEQLKQEAIDTLNQAKETTP